MIYKLKPNNIKVKFKKEIVDNLLDNFSLEYKITNNKIHIEELYISKFLDEIPTDKVINLLTTLKDKFNINKINNIHINIRDMEKNILNKNFINILNKFKTDKFLINIDRDLSDYNPKKMNFLSSKKKRNIEYVIDNFSSHKIYFYITCLLKNNKFNKDIFESSNLYKDLKKYLNNKVHILIQDFFYGNKILYEK